MNLTKLFETQKILRDRIGYNEPDRFNKLVLALLVELGKCANEWRGFKFWSKDQEPRTRVQLFSNSDGTAPDWNTKNPLLEEYVDGLHFVLELGLDRGIDNFKYAVFTSDTTTQQFLFVYQEISKLSLNFNHHYRNMFQLYLGLGEMLGFTWEQIEQAYFDKNKENHRRQDNGY